jgi:transcription elongation factor GreA
VGDYSQLLTSRMANADTHSRLATVKKFLIYLHDNELIPADLNIPSHLRSKRILMTKRGRSSVRTFKEGSKITRSRFKTLNAQLEKLNKEKMRLATDIQNARVDGDVRENAPLEAAREAQGMVMSKITDLENLMRGAIIIDDNSQSVLKGKINIGSKISLENQATKETHSFQLVDFHEADPLSGKISSESPVGKEIMGRAKNEIVTITSPNTYDVDDDGISHRRIIKYKILSNSNR